MPRGRDYWNNNYNTSNFYDYHFYFKIREVNVLSICLTVLQVYLATKTEILCFNITKITETTITE